MNKHINPWSTQSKKLVYHNKWIAVEEHQVLNPAGNPGLYGKVCFKNRAVAVIPLSENLETWLVGQYRYTLDAYSWEIPMGGVPLDEDILQGAKRELREETGIKANHWEHLITLHTSNCVTDELGEVFVARDLTMENPEFDETEEITIQQLPLAEAYQKVLQGDITDAISVAALLKLSIQVL